MSRIARRTETRGVSPLSTGQDVSRAGYRADANYTSTIMNYDNQQYGGFGRTDSEQRFDSEV